ncbi:hypothetical protein [Agilicoccus flavus]|uniref:hypothetical protein n=1 Tax=Agilicoccus flavus TaxID=2775968 RepID=UPI001CF6D4F5|nr:hypothetical protein [Agilicoccus flavus]
MPQIVQTDDRGRVVLSGRRSQSFLMSERPDGTIVLEPGSFVTDAQREYDTDPALRAMLSKAAASATVRRARRAGPTT